MLNALLLLVALAGTGAPPAAVAPAVRRDALQQRIARMEARRDAVVRRHADARAERDVLRVNYIGAKAGAIVSLIRVARDAARALDGALVRGDDLAARHAEEKVALADEKVQRLAAESATAMGEAAMFAGATQLRIFYDEALAGPPAQRVDQLFDLWTKDAQLAERPPAASPYQ